MTKPEDLSLDEIRKQIALYKRIYERMMNELHPERIEKDRERKRRYNAKRRAKNEQLKQLKEQEQAIPVEAFNVSSNSSNSSEPEREQELLQPQPEEKPKPKSRARSEPKSKSQPKLEEGEKPTIKPKRTMKSHASDWNKKYNVEDMALPPVKAK